MSLKSTKKYEKNKKRGKTEKKKRGRQHREKVESGKKDEVGLIGN